VAIVPMIRAGKRRFAAADGTCRFQTAHTRIRYPHFITYRCVKTGTFSDAACISLGLFEGWTGSGTRLFHHMTPVFKPFSSHSNSTHEFPACVRKSCKLLPREGKLSPSFSLNSAESRSHHQTSAMQWQSQ